MVPETLTVPVPLRLVPVPSDMPPESLIVPPAMVMLPRFAVVVMAPAPVPVTLRVFAPTERMVPALPLTVMELRLAVLAMLTISVWPDRLTRTSSPAPGTPFGVQLVLVPQLLPAVQVLVASTAA